MLGAKYIQREMELLLSRCAREFPAIILTGPRQSGKTTLLQHLFGETHKYVSLEDPLNRESALADPLGFLSQYPPPVIFDEIQFTPHLLPFIKEAIDADRQAKGRYLLTGSQNLLLLEKVTESLAGRAAILQLLPLSLREIAGDPFRLLPWEEKTKPEQITPLPLWPIILRGGFPELYLEPGRGTSIWFGSYLQTYLERDVRSLRAIGDLSTFQAFLRGLAARIGQTLNLHNLAGDLGIASNTAKAWLSILQATHQILLLRPYFRNVGKRLVKTPKLYFADTGLAAYLTGLKEPEHAKNSPLAGALMENLVVAEVWKSQLAKGEANGLWYWRTSQGAEVDLLVEHAGGLQAVEIKASETPRKEMIKGIRAFQENYPDLFRGGWVVHAGDRTFSLSPGIQAVSIGSF